MDFFFQAPVISPGRAIAPSGAIDYGNSLDRTSLVILGEANVG